MASPPTGASGALANIVELARLSHLTLLYHGTVTSSADAGREQAAALAGAAATGGAGEVVVLFDAGSDLPVPDLLAEIEAAVLEAAPQAPLAPPMAGPVEALAFWQQALGLRFLLIMHRFDLALSRPDPEFDAVLVKLVHQPLDISLLLVMDETAAPLLQRLKDAIPELGETFLRLPDTAAAAASLNRETTSALPQAPVAMPRVVDADVAPLAKFGPAPFLFDEPAEVQADDAGGQTMHSGQGGMEIAQPAFLHQEQHEAQRAEPQPEEARRSRRFSSLLEQAGTATTAFDPPAETAPESFIPPPAEVAPADPPADRFRAPAPLEIYPATAPVAYVAPAVPLPDGRAEPSFQAVPAAPAPPAAAARVYRERRPMQVAAWMQKRRGRRRRGTVGIASRVGSSSTVLFVLLIMLAVLGWQMPQLGPTARVASPRGSAHAAAQLPQAVAQRGKRYRLSISSAAWSAGTGRETR